MEGPVPVDYEIHGDDMQFVAVTLLSGQTLIAEPGSLMYKTPAITMKAQLGDGSEDGFLGKLVSAGKRALAGESLFMSAFTATGGGPAEIAFAAPYPGKILAVDLSAAGPMLCQKDSFLFATQGITVGIAFARRFGAGLFGGEGFILERLAGSGMAFIHAGGNLLEKELAAGETLEIDTGCIVAFQEGVDYDIRAVRGIKTALFGGEGLFLATLTGPGKIYLQSLPFSRLAGRVIAAAGPLARKEQGGLLGNFMSGD